MKKKLTAWYSAKATLDAAKSAEAELRKEIVAALFANAPPGTHYVDDLLPGYRVRGVVKQNYTVSASAADLKKACAQAGLSYEIFFSDSEKISVKSAWEKMQPKQRAAFAGMISEKPGMPSLDVVEAKEV